MSFQLLVEADAANILNDESNGFAEPVYFRTESRVGSGIFLDSFEDDDDPRNMWLVIDEATFNLYSLDHGHLIYRPTGDNVIDRQTWEIEGYRPEVDGSVWLRLGPTNRVFTVSS